MTMYFVAMVLPEHLNEKILPLKQMMQERYNCKVGLKSPAHITLIPPFWLDEQYEPSLIQDTNTIASGVTPFQISTHNFAAFKPRTIFIDVSPNPELTALKTKTDDFFEGAVTYKVKIDHRPFHPHITIATRDMHKKTFFEAWPLFQDKTFLESWTTNGISILRHNKRNWDVIHTAYFSLI